ncbi:hypothetical protein ACE3MQ_25540 [Paenibacillus lentus]
MGGTEALLRAVPFGDALYFRCVGRFSPFGYVLLLVHPGNLETCCGMGEARRSRAVLCSEPLVALTGPLYVPAPAEGGD